MLFIHGALSIGGIETFYVRMAKQRSAKGLKTAILLLSPKKESNSKLITEMQKYAEIYYLNDFFINIPLLKHVFILLAPPKKENIYKALEDVDQIHTCSALTALVGQRMLKIAKKRIPITVGFYHYIAHIWGYGNKNLAYNVRIDRDFIFNYLPREALLFFSEGNRDYNAHILQTSFEKSQVFRLGVVDKKIFEKNGELTAPINLVAVGRLVEFKTYNLLMLDVISNLSKKGFSIEFNIYGQGPLFEVISRKIKELNLTDIVTLHGTLEYEKFDDIVRNADLFIGSGTAIIQAASLGVPSIVGVENITIPVSYGYFSEVHHHEYNLNTIDLPVRNIEKMIEGFIKMTPEERLNLQREHIESMEDFYNESCQSSMNQLRSIKMPNLYYPIKPLRYEISRLIDKINIKFNKKHPLNTRHSILQK